MPWKLQVMDGSAVYRMTALLSEVSIFYVRAGCEVWFRSYGSKYTSQSRFDKPFVHTYMQNLKSTGHTLYMDGLHIEWLLCYQRHSLCSLELHERFNWKAMRPQTHQSFSDTLCAYTTSPYIHHCLVCNYLWQQTSHTTNKPHVHSHTLWLHTTYQTTALLPKMYRFITTKLANMLHVAVSFN